MMYHGEGGGGNVHNPSHASSCCCCCLSLLLLLSLLFHLKMVTTRSSMNKNNKNASNATTSSANTTLARIPRVLSETRSLSSYNGSITYTSNMGFVPFKMVTTRSTSNNNSAYSNASNAIASNASSPTMMDFISDTGSLSSYDGSVHEEETMDVDSPATTPTDARYTTRPASPSQRSTRPS